MGKVRITKRARNDLVNIWDYTAAAWSRSQAEKYCSDILNLCQELVDGTKVGRVYNVIDNSLRGANSGNHIIFYSRSSPDEIIVARILHVRMDLPRKWKPE